ncbi:9204_t:CDS:2 [Racocetra fulgida]|uniref:9204_t:CDS:1 n=1 Tax=Racocetra fulgida TaxID=60492 RepID=A0A9N8ZD23_9GLOM|nr:9204_t:CDS:2 [Racocetra fulgida]
MSTQESGNWTDYDSETGSEPDINKNGISLPRKRQKKHKRTAEVWKYFELEGSCAICQENDFKIIRFNELSSIEMDQEVGSGEEDEETSEATIKILHAITWLSSILPLKKGIDNKKDSQILSQRLLKDYEWDLLEKIIMVLKPFEHATTLFSGSKYPTLSLMYPIIQKLQNQFMDYEFELNNIETSNNDDDDYESDISLDCESDDELYSQPHDTHLLPPPPNLNHIVQEFKSTIYKSLMHYWNEFHEIGLVATLLDPHTKRMTAFTSREREKARAKLRSEFEISQQHNITSNNNPEQGISTITTNLTQNPFFEGIFGIQDQKEIEPLDEIAQYLDLKVVTISQLIVKEFENNDSKPALE